MAGIGLERTGRGVVVVTIDRPDVLNAVDVPAKEALAAAWREIEADDAIRAAVIRGAGSRAFSAGSDIKEIRRTGQMVSTETLIRAIPNGEGLLKTPIVAAIQGYCIGFGLTLALHCDFRLADPAAVFSFPEVDHGMISAVSACRLARVVGTTMATEMLLLGGRYSADQMRACGLLNEIAGDVVERAHDMAQRLADKPVPAVQAHKRLAAFAGRQFLEAERREIEAVRAWLESHDDFKEGAERFDRRKS
ncbi:MAG: enoyl-CoA hydratase/isomerase family protein [Azospirillaceae bacterium]